MNSWKFEKQDHQKAFLMDHDRQYASQAASGVFFVWCAELDPENRDVRESDEKTMWRLSFRFVFSPPQLTVDPNFCLAIFLKNSAKSKEWKSWRHSRLRLPALRFFTIGHWGCTIHHSKRSGILHEGRPAYRRLSAENEPLDWPMKWLAGEILTWASYAVCKSTRKLSKSDGLSC